MAGLKAEQGFDLLKSGRYSDLTITCGGHLFKVHKAVICPQSQFFAACLRSKFTEARKSNIDMHDTDAKALAIAILYMYTDETDLAQAQSIWPQFDFHSETGHTLRVAMAKMSMNTYLIADRLLMPDLKARMHGIFTSNLAHPEFNWSITMSNENPFEALVGVLEEVYEKMPAHDSVIRLAATVHATKLFTFDTKPFAIASVLLKHEPMAFRVAMVLRDIHID